MAIESEHRVSDSPHVALVWRGRASGTGTMTSVATSTWELVFWEDGGAVRAAVRGPETAASTVELAGDSESLGIIFAHGTVLSPLPRLVDSAAESPHVTERTFALGGREWEIPDFDSAEDLVVRLAREGMISRDPLVDEVVWGGIARVGTRSVQRRVATATGLTQGAIRQIERAREAAVLLGEGLAPLDVVHRLGYYDQPHLSRSLRRFIGRTATELQQADGSMSLLYKTEPPAGP
ncbi:AraC family transcriptional regulator [Nocardiopsis lambiniae]|uniref:Helix-turn-helix domain-containing protein n=1 Tax=Nocardiopsis lambiniae TaxID=3075539 RepID=A0ABU2MAX1_9ACTN|nr:helix-turn-helix domain-containing protein [Nocardiopsis sp. DSM 44743]MDT0329828.1 helix-turn-helix domain-containing protein [Nocardiopsis sp. DSM 44743]